MADKTATLKTQAGDNVYPNVIGENRKDSFADSSTIKHYYYDKTHKVGFQLANETNNKITNSLQKPAGLTKTELVGVGTNGQENIEIGDNLTLANGKLSASGGSGGGFEYDSITPNDAYNSYTGTITGDRPVYDTVLKGFLQGISYGAGFYNHLKFLFTGSGVSLCIEQLLFYDNIIQTNNKYYIQEKLYLHFITMTYSNNNIVLYLTILKTDNTAFTANTLASYLAGKKVLANGNMNGNIPTYIAGEGGNIKMYYRTAGDTNINQEPDVYSDLSSFAISDLVSEIISPLE